MVDDEEAQPKSKGKKSAAAQPSQDTVCAELSGKRKVTVGKFKGSLFVNIREARRRARARKPCDTLLGACSPSLTPSALQYYEKDGQELPGKKGIALTPEQWESLKASMPAVEAALAAQGGMKE